MIYSLTVGSQSKSLFYHEPSNHHPTVRHNDTYSFQSIVELPCPVRVARYIRVKGTAHDHTLDHDDYDIDQIRAELAKP